MDRKKDAALAVVPYSQLEEAVEARRAMIATALPEGVDPDRWISLALYAIAKEPKLQLCTAESLIRGIRESAALGLEIGSSLGQASLVPFWNSKKGAYEAVFIPMYQGLLELLYRTGEIASHACEVVYDCDEFVYMPSHPTQPVVHRPAMERPAIARRIGVYFEAWLRGSGRPIATVLRASEVEMIRKSARAADDGPWITHPDAMWRKTAVRQGMKLLPKSPQLRRVLALEEEAELEAGTPPAAARLGLSGARSTLLAELGLAQEPAEAGETTDHTAEQANGRPGASVGPTDDPGGEASGD